MWGRLWVCECLHECAHERVYVGLIVVQAWGTAERTHIWHQRTSMVTGNLTTQPVLWWQVSLCVARGESDWLRPEKSVRKKSVLKKGRWAVKHHYAHPACSRDTFKNSKESCKQFLHRSCWWSGLCYYAYNIIYQRQFASNCHKLYRGRKMYPWILPGKLIWGKSPCGKWKKVAKHVLDEHACGLVRGSDHQSRSPQLGFQHAAKG